MPTKPLPPAEPTDEAEPAESAEQDTSSEQAEPAEQAAFALPDLDVPVDTIDASELSFTARNNAKMTKRQNEYEDALRTLTPGANPIVFHFQGTKTSARGLKLRLSYAAKRLKLTGVDIGDAKVSATGEPIVYARIK